MTRKSQSHDAAQTGNDKINSKNTIGCLSMSALRHDASPNSVEVQGRYSIIPPPLPAVLKHVRIGAAQFFRALAKGEEE
jgi:hypothetical protein